ncbi:MAG: hypothetical protein U0I89_08400 [Prevotella sp.]|nr:hypothetical protein [Prevotella sp.]MEE0337294.1 hypothetical protein [Prevotella sp.]
MISKDRRGYKGRAMMMMRADKNKKGLTAYRLMPDGSSTASRKPYKL